jgi:pimeloyl-ACP methyl ester carboxylesterase
MKTVVKILLGLVAFVILVVVGGFFAMKAADIPYATLEAKYANSASKFIDLPSGVHMHYRDQGDPKGRALVLIHGFGLSLETWEPWVKALGSNYRLISVDLPGHGLTRAPEAYSPTITAFADIVAEFATAIGLDKFNVGGNSMGGNTAWLVAMKYPARVDALVLVDAGGWPTPEMQSGTREDQPLVFRLIANPQIAPLLAQLDPTPLMRNGLKLAYYNDALATDAMVTRYAEFARAPGHRQFIGQIQRRMTSDVFATDAKLAVIQVPTLILWGDKDELIPVTDAPKFSKAIAGSTVIIYQGIGHIPSEEAAEKSAADLKAFLEKNPSRAEKGAQ